MKSQGTSLDIGNQNEVTKAPKLKEMDQSVSFNNMDEDDVLLSNRNQIKRKSTLQLKVPGIRDSHFKPIV